MFTALAANPSDTSGVAPWMQMVVVLLVVGIGFFLVWHTRSRIARSNAGRKPAREQIDDIKARAEVQTGVHAALAKLLDTSQRLAAQLDDKAVRLDQLILEADERIRTLGMTPPPPQAQAETAEEGPSLHLAGDGGDEGTGETPAPAPEPKSAPSDPPTIETTLDPITKKIYHLADEGRSAVEIAQELEEQTGNVELVLALRKDAPSS